MIHPHATWSRQALENLVGMTETLTLEFKSYRALVWNGDSNRRRMVIAEAAKDVAALANEQGGTLIYGIEEEKRGVRRRALRVEEGFTVDHNISREWFLSTMRANIYPPLPDLDAIDVDVGDDRIALVVLVPQSVGSARQTGDPRTGDLKFWRRDAQGEHNMTVQEINDIASRARRPILELKLGPTVATANIPLPMVEAVGSKENPLGLSESRTRFQARIGFEIRNDSPATADFAVITIALPDGVFTPPPDSEWLWFRAHGRWRMHRTVIASGSSARWSPITPDFALAAQPFSINMPAGVNDWELDRWPWFIGLARLDHSGGSRTYSLELTRSSVNGWVSPTQAQLQLRIFPDDFAENVIQDLDIPEWFLPRTTR